MKKTFEACGRTVYGQLMPVLRSFCSMSLTSDLDDPQVLTPSKFTTVCRWYHKLCGTLLNLHGQHSKSLTDAVDAWPSP
jgi:hypothetical protein